MKLLTVLFTALASCAVARGSAVASPANELAYLASEVGSTTPCHGGSQDTPVAGPPAHITNAERLRRHLPLMPPTRRSRNLAPRASVLPIASTGKIAVTRSDNGNHIGYIVPVTVGGSLKSYTFGPLENAISVQLESTTGGGRISIAVLSNPYPSYGYLGFAAQPGYQNHDPAGFGYSWITGTSYIGQGSTPVSGNNAAFPTGWAETSIWNLDLSTKALTAQWISPNGAQHASLLYYSHTNFLGLLSDLNKYKQTFSAANPYLVTLTYVPDV